MNWNFLNRILPKNNGASPAQVGAPTVDSPLVPPETPTPERISAPPRGDEFVQPAKNYVPPPSTRNISEFERELFATGNLKKARLAAGWREGQAKKGRDGLNREFLAVVDRWEEGRERGKPSPAEVVKVQSEVKPQVLPPAMVANQFKPGESGNPEGGSIARTFRTAVERKLDREGADMYVESVAGIAIGAKYDSDKIKAAEWLRDTAGEKPTQNLRYAGIIIMMPSESVMAAAFGVPEPEE